MFPKTTLSFLLVFLILFPSYGQNRVPEITNVVAVVNADAGQIHIGFDLEDPESDQLSVSLNVSKDGGESFTVQPISLSGDVGFPIAPGGRKNIDWDYEADLESPDNILIRIIATDFIQIDLRDLADLVDTTFLKDNLRNEIEGDRHFSTDPFHLEEVRQACENHLEAPEISVDRQTWTFNGNTGGNIIATIKGTENDQEVYFLTGHLDGVSGSPGADDNGSAITALWEAARILSGYSYKSSVRFVAFDFEEAGLLGSKEYLLAHLAPGETVAGVINLEMIGFYDNTPFSQQLPTGFNLLFPSQYNALVANDFRGDFITNVGSDNTPWLGAYFDSIASEIVPSLSVLSFDVLGSGFTTPDFRRSDHASFWDAGLPAIMLTDGADFRNPYYHTPADSSGHLDFGFLGDVTKASMVAIADLAGIHHTTTATVSPQAGTGRAPILKERCQLHLFPNPTSGQLKLNAEGCPAGSPFLRMYSNDGKMVELGQMSGNGKMVDLKKFESGKYILEASWENLSIREALVIAPR